MTETYQPSGILFVYKPRGPTSSQIVQSIKKLLKSNSQEVPAIGHIGTLDPFAEGLLGICIGEATKLSQVFLAGEKTYEAELVWGKSTLTGDLTGDPIEQTELPASFFSYTDSELEEKLARFSESYHEQIPPMYSAKKIDGVRLYTMARRGESVERAPQPVTIYNSKLLRTTRNPNLERVYLRITCSGGTYIRTLAEDFAKALGGCSHLSRLIRTQVKGIQTTPLDDIEFSHSLPIAIHEENFSKKVLSSLKPVSLTGVWWIPLNQILREDFSQGDFRELHVTRSIFESIQKGQQNHYLTKLSDFLKLPQNQILQNKPKSIIKNTTIESVASNEVVNPTQTKPVFVGAYFNENLIALFQYEQKSWTFLRGFTLPQI